MAELGMNSDTLVMELRGESIEYSNYPLYREISMIVLNLHSLYHGLIDNILLIDFGEGERET